MRAWVVVVGMLGCRDYHEPAPFVDCQPYPLECVTCTYDDDAADDTSLQRVFACATADGSLYDAVQRRAPDAAADDTHYYDVGSGLRAAAARRYDAVTDVCGRDLDIEWYGQILEPCEALCDEPGLPDADPSLPDCDDANAG